MPLRNEPLEEPQLNLTAMVDVVLQLVIFFMVGTQFVDTERKVDITLPLVSQAAPLTETPDEIVVNVARDGEITLSGAVVTLENLRERLQEAKRLYADQAVVIRGDMDCIYQQVMTVVDVCKQAGIDKLQVATRVQSPGAK
ncbi:Biopolymer transport protein ExbD [Caulifigura coniformis]|uniref:Biopolymer transport protein ExbD n=1 Tax=Caulifigura coniformis TaxID=2527983 RepID=A0A517S8L5_9PLAN|nr:biopolymer transporter ExbD [Caulifigura coniformis]QDT52467.1 Biopolymer transport protein ExbD [Caulifigura coniformis]